MLAPEAASGNRDPTSPSVDVTSPIPGDLLKRLERAEQNLTTRSAEDQHELAPKLATLRASIGEMSDLYEQRLAEVKARNQLAMDELQRLATRVSRRDARQAEEASPEQGSDKENAAKKEPRTPEGPPKKEVREESVKKADKPTRSRRGGARAKAQRERRNSIDGPALPLGPRAAPGPGWLAQAVPAVLQPPHPDQVAQAMAPWLRAAQALGQVPEAYPTQAPAPAPAPAPAAQEPESSPSPRKFGRAPAGTPYTPFVPEPTPSPTWDTDERMSIGGLLRRPVQTLSLSTLV